MATAIKGLDNATIVSLMGKGRARNAYAPKLQIFLDSDEPAVDVKDVWPEFAAKQATTLYQGFRTAISAHPELEDILVKQDDGHVYLMHTARINARLAEVA